MKNEVFLLIGGNLADRFLLLKEAKKGISKKIGFIKMESSIYETAPWGFESEHDFLNQVIIVDSDLDAFQILKRCQLIEKELGRERLSKAYSSRTMDIDILFFNNEIIETPVLTIPHERLHLRKFTLEPLVELEPNFVHPIIEKSLSEILFECEDKSAVKKL